MPKTAQFRTIGPVTLPECSAEELDSLRSAVVREGSKVRYVIISSYASQPDGDEGSSDSGGTTVCLCAQSPDKMSAGEWMQQLGMMAHADKARRALIKERLIPSDNMERAIRVCRAYASIPGGEEEFGIAPRSLKRAGVCHGSVLPLVGKRNADACTQTDDGSGPDSDLSNVFGERGEHNAAKRQAILVDTEVEHSESSARHLKYMAAVLKRLEAKPAVRQFPTYVHPKTACRALLNARLGPLDTPESVKEGDVQ